MINLYHVQLEDYARALERMTGKRVICYFTGRKTVSGNNRSHAMNKTKRVVKPNLQKVTVLIDGKPKKVWASARALKSGKVERV